jgi:hypothetical protein
MPSPILEQIYLRCGKHSGEVTMRKGTRLLYFRGPLDNTVWYLVFSFVYRMECQR